MKVAAIRKTAILLTMLWVASAPAFAQQKVKVRQVHGEWRVSNDITPAQAREKAIAEAKSEALRQAGAPELVTASNILYHSEGSTKPKDFFESLTSVGMSGELSEVNITKEEKKFDQQGNIIYEIWLDATVVIHKEPKDPGFGLEVSGVREQYNSPDKLSFEIQPWKDGYLTLFILSEKEGTVLFPNNLEHQVKLTAQKKYDFPLSRGLDYEVSTDRDSEVNYLLLLFTKDEIPFLKEQTPQNILSFIGAIEPPRKYLKSFSFLIRK